MNTSPVLDNAVALLLAAHAAHQAEREAGERQTYILRGDVEHASPEMKARLTEAGFGKVFAPKVETKAKSRKVEGDKAPVVKAKQGPQVFGMSLEQAGTLDAAGFISAVRNAGKRLNDKGVMAFNPLMVRDDTIKAIACYIGYNSTGDFGTQDIAARAQAMRELGIAKTSGKTRAEQREEYRGVQGVIFGLPDHSAKRLADLKAQAKAAVDGLIIAENAGDAVTAMVERAKLDACEQAIADFR